MAGATSEYTGGQGTNRKVEPDTETRMAFLEGGSDLPELRQSLQEFRRWCNRRERESLDWKTPEECYRIEVAPSSQ